MAIKTTTIKCPKCRSEIEVLSSSIHDDRDTIVQCNHVKKNGEMCGNKITIEAESD